MLGVFVAYLPDLIRGRYARAAAEARGRYARAAAFHTTWHAAFEATAAFRGTLRVPEVHERDWSAGAKVVLQLLPISAVWKASHQQLGSRIIVHSLHGHCDLGAHQHT